MNFKDTNPEQFQALMEQKYNTKKFRGLELKNANGDIATSSLAYQYATDRLTFIRQRTVTQSFYEVLPSDFIDVIPGEGAFSAQIITNATIQTAGGFGQGKINTAKGNAKLGIADAAVLPVYTKVMNWALAVEYSIFDVEQSLFSGNWDIVEMKHKARKMDWDLGIQAISFLGDPDDLTNYPGLYTLAGVNIDTTTITKNISAMSAAEFSTFVAAIIGKFLANCNQTRYPNTFVIPQDDYVGLATPVSSTYPNISMLSYLQQAFDAIVPNGKVRIMPCAYGMTAYNAGVSISKQRYILFRKDIDTVFMEIPVDYQTTAVGTLNNFNYQDVAYGQYTGVVALKPLEIMYFDHT